jgi:hypothetical protein
LLVGNLWSDWSASDSYANGAFALEVAKVAQNLTEVFVRQIFDLKRPFSALVAVEFVAVPR